jgi:hypothetical protein
MAGPQAWKREKSSTKPMPVTVESDWSPLSEDRVRFRAYLLFQERQRAGIPGDPASDWFRAQRELNEASRRPERARSA